MNATQTKLPILVIDDDKRYCDLIQEYLTPQGYIVDYANSGNEGLARIKETSYSAAILDVMMPGKDGFETLKELRTFSTLPVLMLTARGDEIDRIVGLEIGADDYLAKTFSPRELLARLRAVIRRSTMSTPEQASSSEPEPEELSIGDLTLNASTYTCTQDGRNLELTALEFSMLYLLMKAPGHVKSREQLLVEISDRHYDVFDRSIDVHVSALRKKLSDDAKKPRYIRTIRSVGYQFIDSDNDT